MGERRYLEIPGMDTHELPPLLVHGPAGPPPLDEVVERAAGIVESEDLLAESAADRLDWEQRRFDLAIHLVEQYRDFLSRWNWGDSILEWIRQCEITFETRATLRHLLHPDVWPHASRSSFVTLLQDKSVLQPESALERAVGLRLTFRQPPPIDCFSNQFLIYLNSPVAGTAYQTWAHLSAQVPACLPPHRFHFEVHEM